jgi:hypothetical protein
MLVLIAIWLVIISALITIKAITKPFKKARCTDCGNKNAGMICFADTPKVLVCQDCLFSYQVKYFDEKDEPYNRFNPLYHDLQEYYKDLSKEIKNK